MNRIGAGALSVFIYLGSLGLLVLMFGWPKAWVVMLLAVACGVLAAKLWRRYGEN